MGKQLSASRKKAIRDVIGDPRKIDEELVQFRRAAQRFSSDQPRFIEKYPNQWVAVFDGKVEASAKTHDDLLRAIDEKKLPRNRVMTRYIEDRQRTFIL